MSPVPRRKKRNNRLIYGFCTTKKKEVIQANFVLNLIKIDKNLI